MKLGFIFDTRFFKYGEDFYSTNLSQDFWENRYLGEFDNIVVVGRYVEIKENPEGKLVKSNGDRVTFCCIKDMGTTKRLLSQSRQSHAIEMAIQDCDRIICRGWWGVNVCKRLQKPYMMEVISCAWDSYWNHSVVGKIMAAPNFLLQKRAIKEAQYVLYVTKEFLQKRYPTKGYSVGISDVDLNYCKKEDREQILNKRVEKIQRKHNKIIIGTAGSVAVKYKGQRFVIEALALLKKKGYTHFEYQLAGKGDSQYLQSIAKEKGVEDQVKFIGSIPHQKMFSWLDSLDIYMQPSLTEGLPRAVVEAMSRALPCIGTRVGGIPELIEETFLVDTKKSLPRQIAVLLETLDETRQISTAKRNFALSADFLSDVLDERRQDFIRQFVKEGLI